MKLTSHSSELTAYALNEVTVEERVLLDLALAESPELRTEIAALRHVSHTLATQLNLEPSAELEPERLDAVLKKAANPSGSGQDTAPAPPSALNWFSQLWTGLTRPVVGFSLAAATALSIALALWMPWKEPKDKALAEKLTPQTTNLADATPELPSTPKAQNERLLVSKAAKRVAGRPEVALDGATTGDPQRSEVEAIRLKQLGAPLGHADLQSARKSLTDADLMARYALQPRVEIEGKSDSRTTKRSTRFEPDLGPEFSAQKNTFRSAVDAPVSTFPIKTDTASYAEVRRSLREGIIPPTNAVRLEELVNYFPYDYALPVGTNAFATYIETADCPWNTDNILVRIGVKAREIEPKKQLRVSLVFLVNVSNSMIAENKLPLIQESLGSLLDQLTPRDSVSIVTFAGDSRVTLEPTLMAERMVIQKAIDSLRAGGETHDGTGLQEAYAKATNRFIRDGINRVILCTDGNFNRDSTRSDELINQLSKKTQNGVSLSVLEYGDQTPRDTRAKVFADRSGGSYTSVDSIAEARKVLKREVRGPVETVAKETKVQVEFNPTQVATWRLLGYENRQPKDLNSQTNRPDGEDVESGQAVTALYEIVPLARTGTKIDPSNYGATTNAAGLISKGASSSTNRDLFNLKVRYKEPEGTVPRLIQVPVAGPSQDRDEVAATADYKFAAAVVGYGLMLRDSPMKGDLNWEKVLRLAEEGLGPDREGYRAEFIRLVHRAKGLSGR